MNKILKNYLMLTFAILINITLWGQVKKGQLIEEKVIYQYDEKKPSESIEPNVDLGKEILIVFDCCFNDTVQIFIGDKLIEKVYLKTDESASFTGFAMKIKLEENKKTTTLKLVLPNREIYCNIILDKKYRILNVNRMENSEKTWWITFRNYAITYE